MDKFLYLSSTDSDLLFADNETFRFKVHLKTPLNLRGYWKVGLVECHAKQTLSKTKGSKKDEALYIFSDICKESILQGIEQPLLRRLQPNLKGQWAYTLDNVLYVPVRSKEITEFQVDIRLADGAHPSFLVSPVYMTLHLKSYPFFVDNESI